MCEACFRSELTQIVTADVHSPCDSLRSLINLFRSPYRVPRQSDSIDEIRLLTKLSSHQQAVSLRKSDLYRKQQTLETLKNDIERINADLRQMTLERITLKYRLSCVVLVDKVPSILCTECNFRFEHREKRKYIHSFESEKRLNGVEVSCCSSKCSCM